MKELGNPHVQNTTTSSNMATAFPACSTRAAKPYGRHRPPNTPTSGLTKNVIKSVKGNNMNIDFLA